MMFKKHPKTAIALVILAIAMLYSYSWTFTPNGRLGYPAAVSLHLFTFPYKLKPDPSSDLELNLPINLAFSLDAVLPAPGVRSTRDVGIPGQGVEVPARVYWPKSDDRSPPLPVVVYFHGGGFMLGDIDIFDPLARSIVNSTNAIVISVGYRLTPKHPFPAGLDDCYAAVRWAAQNAASLGGDPAKLVVAGDSAGGNLAAVVSLKARNEGGPAIAGQMLYYPVVDLSETRYASNDKFDDGYGLSKEMGKTFRDAYIGHLADGRNPYVSPLYAESLTGLPPTLVLTGGFDTLTDATLLYVEKLKKSGVPVVAHHYPATIHGFMGVRVFPERGEGLKASGQFMETLFASPGI